MGPQNPWSLKDVLKKRPPKPQSPKEAHMVAVLEALTGSSTFGGGGGGARVERSLQHQGLGLRA